MFKAILLSLGFFVAANANAASTYINTALEVTQQMLNGPVAEGTFDWKAGDEADYNMNMGFISGKMIMKVVSVAPTEVVFSQDVDLGFLGKQHCDITINPTNGQTKSLVCNGQAQDTSGGDVSVIESKEDTVTVPAGTFTCMYIKAQQTVQGNAQTVEQWINPKMIPVMGMAKTIAPSQMGQVVVELTAFHKN